MGIEERLIYMQDITMPY